MAKAVERVTSEILSQAQHEHTLTPPFGFIGDNYWEHPKDENGNPVHGYVARPLAGIWATPPYLHNGSVPTLYDLLSPSKLPPTVPKSTKVKGDTYVRPECFRLGTMQFDPKYVGYETLDCEFQNRPDSLHSGFSFWTTRPGNSNAGHEFTNYDKNGKRFKDCDTSKEKVQKKLRQHAQDGVLGCAFNHKERMAIIEYLKTNELNEPFKSVEDAQWGAVAPPNPYCPSKKPNNTDDTRNEPVYKRG